MTIIKEISLIFLFTFLGDFIQKISNTAIPGSILGLSLLFLALHFKVIKIEEIENTGSFLQKNMGILFVPVTVGILNYMDMIQKHGLKLLLILILSTSLTYVFTAKMSEKMLKREAENND